MAKKQILTYEQKIFNALDSLPNPLEDKKHRIFIVFDNRRARSNEDRYEHIASFRHELTTHDIKRIPKRLKTSILKKDLERKNTYNLYIERNSFSGEYIKISMNLNFKESNKAIVKTIFITKNLK